MRDANRGMCNSLLTLAIAMFVPVGTAYSGVAPIESTLAMRAASYADPGGSDAVGQTALGAGASALSISPTATASANGTVSKSSVLVGLAFTSPEQGQMSLNFLGETLSVGPNFPGSGISMNSITVPVSTFNTDVQRPGTATYAFGVGGSGSVALDWTIASNNTRNSQVSNDLLYRRFSLGTIASLVHMRNGSVLETLDGPAPVMISSGTASIPFSALAGDVMILRLMPSVSYSNDGSLRVGATNIDVALQFSISAVPEPPMYAALLAGLGLVLVAHSRKRRRDRN